jgi:hypothetical protein
MSLSLYESFKEAYTGVAAAPAVEVKHAPKIDRKHQVKETDDGTFEIMYNILAGRVHQLPKGAKDILKDTMKETGMYDFMAVRGLTDAEFDNEFSKLTTQILGRIPSTMAELDFFLMALYDSIVTAYRPAGSERIISF